MAASHPAASLPKVVAGGSGQYNIDDVDKHVLDLEKNAAMVIRAGESAVKGRSAEFGLLQACERTCITCNKAMKGDKDHLEEVFGGTCERIGRMHQVLTTTELKQYPKDDRWGRLKHDVESIEKILADRGMFKPWKPGGQAAPEQLRYRFRRRVSPRRSFYQKPDISGEVDKWSLLDAPDGISIDPTTGIISGKIDDRADEVKFTVVATNSGGTTETEISFKCTDPAPQGLQYPGLEGLVTVGENHIFTPIFEGVGSGKSFKVEPELPAGMSLNEETGQIDGVVQEVVPTQEYTVVASNSGGECTCVLDFGTQVPAPNGLSYPDLADTLDVGQAVNFVPHVDVGLPEEFSVSPELPEGLSLDASMGDLKGKPTAPADSKVYVVTAKNGGGECKAELVFAVQAHPPQTLTYEGVDEAYTAGLSHISLEPKVTGGAPEKFEIEPELPEGLVLSGVAGTVVGCPTALTPQTTYTVTTSNEHGSCQGSFSFEVVRAPPENLTYPQLEPVYAVGREMTVHPTVDGEVDAYDIDPPLPEGLGLDPSSGSITGTPVGASGSKYCVTAKNDQGMAVAYLEFNCKVMPPESISYPSADDVYHVNEAVNMAPTVQGGVDRFAVEPALPEGMEFGEETGTISGAPTEIAAQRAYTITASNEGGKTSCEVEFRVDPCAPETLSYPSLGSTIVVEDELDCEAEVHPPSQYSFAVEPPLPAGLSLEESTGRITGSPTEADERQANNSYVVTATNVSGSVACSVALTVEEKPEEVVADMAFVAQVEECEDIEVLQSMAPKKEQRSGDWMIWMVHRAFLNDPTLEDFNFTHCKMHLPHEEYRVAPKLMKALETNTHIMRLSLAHANMQKPQGHEMGEALKKNCSLEVLNIESNFLDSDCLKHIAEGIHENSNTQLKEVRVSHQQGLGKYYGRPVEVAFTEMMRKNTSITKLGLYLDDANCRDVIDRALLRNNDRARRLRKRSTVFQEEELPQEEKTLNSFTLQKPPMVSVTELLGTEESGVAAFKKFLVDQRKVPTTTQLQNAAKSAGTPMPFSQVKPTLEKCRKLLVNAALRTHVTVIDIYGSQLNGNLLKWEVSKTGVNWYVTIVDEQQEKKLMCKSEKEPAISISDGWVEWLQGKVVEPEPDDESEAEAEAEADTKDDESV